MEDIKVTVVTVCLNSEKTIEQAIKSVVDQSYGNIEYIIVDGASTDGTLDIVRKYGEYITRFVSEPDDGIYDAMNKGIDMATGELIAFLGSDDWYEVDAIKKVVNQYKETNADIVHGKVNCIEKDRCTVREVAGLDGDLRKLYSAAMIPHQGSFTKLSLMKKYRFDVRYKIAADRNFFIKALHNGCKFSYINEVLANYGLYGFSAKPYRALRDSYKAVSEFMKNDSEWEREYRPELEEYYKYGIARAIFKRMQRYHKEVKYSKKFIPNKSKLYLFGTGIICREMVKILKYNDIEISGFIDNNKEKQNTEFLGKKIIATEKLRKIPNATIFIAVGWKGIEIRKQLSEMNLGHCRIYSFVDWVQDVAACYLKDVFSTRK